MFKHSPYTVTGGRRSGEESGSSDIAITCHDGPIHMSTIAAKREQGEHTAHCLQIVGSNASPPSLPALKPKWRLLCQLPALLDAEIRGLAPSRWKPSPKHVQTQFTVKLYLFWGHCSAE